MPSTSPGVSTPKPANFAQVIPGAPNIGLQSIASFTFRDKRFVAYISGRQLNILLSPVVFVQALAFSHDLIAVTSEPRSGKLLVADKVNVYVLDPHAEGWTKEWWERCLILRRDNVGEDAVQCLSWGSSGEVLIGGTKTLALFSTLPSSNRSSSLDVSSLPERHPLWTTKVANAVQHALFNPTARMMVTCGQRDRLVKVWRFLSFEDYVFDYSYLPHPAPVAHLQWRQDREKDDDHSPRYEDDQDVLYTMATDGVLRVWKTGGPFDLDFLVLHTTIDLVSAIPQSPSLTSDGMSSTSQPVRFAFMLPADQFSAAVSAVHIRKTDDKISHSLEHLKEVVSRSPDVFVIMDGQGRMSAWGLHSIAHKRRNEDIQEIFHIAHSEGLKLCMQTNARFQAWFDNDKIHLIAHQFDDRVEWWQGSVEKFLSPSAPGPERLSLDARWVGHHSPVQELSTHMNGKTLFSKSLSGGVAIWNLESNGRLVQQLLAWSGKPHTFEAKGKVEVPFETGIVDPSIAVTNDTVAAVVSADGTELVVVEMEEGYVEHRQTFQEPVKHLKLNDDYNLIVVAFSTHALVLVQGRYEHGEKPGIWTAIKTISIDGLGLQISAIEWLHDGSVAVACGNGILLAANTVTGQDIHPDLRDKCDIAEDAIIPILQVPAKIKNPLPAYHPRMLSHLIHHGDMTSATQTLTNLASKLKFWSEGDDLSLDATTPQPLTDEVVADLIIQLQTKDLPSVSSIDQTRLLPILESLLFCSTLTSTLDPFSLRYLFTWRYHTLARPGITPIMNPRAICFAYHSSTQSPLLTLLTQPYTPQNPLTWPVAKSLGLPSLLNTSDSLTSFLETLAQSTYRSTHPPDPTQSSLFFLALRRKSTLQNLWRLASWHKEQRATLKFLQRDFSTPENRSAAKKNAYALMGKRRFEYAAAFFLLADDPASACGVLAAQCGDCDLAVAVARVYAGEGSEVLRTLVEGRVIEPARGEGDRWRLCWGYEILGRRDEARECLVEPLKGVGVRLARQDDPATLVLYRDLRGDKGSRFEFQAVLRAARVLRRMGLWTIALELVSGWVFTREEKGEKGEKGEELEEGETNDMLPPPPPPTQFQEPDAGSLLDSFGF
ncbi:hypothetical protein K470DRAFT_256930 [Piedraia hortae CBS 480.64]|uniref:RAVE complex protein Rav1 C-terminal domain-containing protein n=1 Tax=Piedraia hortae CBS 480.64 TaxID=1314780 RepID=A0A6A7C268_9PEZI|nr:hypothetical protein K470DRAFT_256930 [Piedraia hortae CBS 480.64]